MPIPVTAPVLSQAAEAAKAAILATKPTQSSNKAGAVTIKWSEQSTAKKVGIAAATVLSGGAFAVLYALVYGAAKVVDGLCNLRERMTFKPSELQTALDRAQTAIARRALGAPVSSSTVDGGNALQREIEAREDEFQASLVELINAAERFAKSKNQPVAPVTEALINILNAKPDLVRKIRSLTGQSLINIFETMDVKRVNAGTLQAMFADIRAASTDETLTDAVLFGKLCEQFKQQKVDDKAIDALIVETTKAENVVNTKKQIDAVRATKLAPLEAEAVKLMGSNGNNGTIHDATVARDAAKTNWSNAMNAILAKFASAPTDANNPAKSEQERTDALLKAAASLTGILPQDLQSLKQATGELQQAQKLVDERNERKNVLVGVFEGLGNAHPKSAIGTLRGHNTQALAQAQVNNHAKFLAMVAAGVKGNVVDTEVTEYISKANERAALPF